MLQLTRTHELTDNSHVTHISIFMYIIHIVAGIQSVQQVFTIYQKLTLVDVHIVVNIQFISYK